MLTGAGTGPDGALKPFADPLGPYGNVMGLGRTGAAQDGDAYVEAETHDRRRIDLPLPQQKLATDVRHSQIFRWFPLVLTDIPVVLLVLTRC